MNEKQVDIFEARQSVLDSIDDIVAYSKAFHKKKPVNQLSLFDSCEIEIKRPDIINRKLSQYELLELAEKETDLTGLSLTYDIFDDYILLDKTLCSHNLQEASFCSENNKSLTFLAKITSAEIGVSKWGNKYAKVTLERNGITIKSYLRGDDWLRRYQNIILGEVYIVRCLYNNEFFSIQRMSNCRQINSLDYIKSINIDIPKDKVSIVSAYMFKEAILKGNTPINYVIDGNIFENIYIGLFSSKICLELIKIGCKININRVL